MAVLSWRKATSRFMAGVSEKRPRLWAAVQVEVIELGLFTVPIPRAAVSPESADRCAAGRRLDRL